MQLIRRGLKHRAIRSTGIDKISDSKHLFLRIYVNLWVSSCVEFNAESSRSHTILQLFVQTEESDVNGATVLKRSMLSLVDLAGDLSSLKHTLFAFEFFMLLQGLRSGDRH